VKKSETEVAQRQAPSATYSQSGENGSEVVNHNVLLIEGNSLYLLVSIAPKDEFDRSAG